MKKSHDNLSENQQKIINGLIEEFSKNNEKKPKVKSSNFIDAWADEGNEYLRKKEIFYATITEHNAEMRAKAEEALHQLSTKLKKLFKDYAVDITTYIGNDNVIIVSPPKNPSYHLIYIKQSFTAKRTKNGSVYHAYDSTSSGVVILDSFGFSIQEKILGSELEQCEVFKNAVITMFKKHKIEKI